MFEFEPTSFGIEVGSWAPICLCRWAQIGWNGGVFSGSDLGEIEVACWVWIWNQIGVYRGGLLCLDLSGIDVNVLPGFGRKSVGIEVGCCARI